MFANFPTDSLNKFMFFAGIVLMITGYVRSREISEQLDLNYDAQEEIATGQIAESEIQIKYLTMALDSIDAVFKNYNAGRTDTTAPVVASKPLSPTQWKSEALKEKDRTDSVRANNNLEKLARKNKSLTNDLILSYGFLVTGVVFASLGFFLWGVADKEAQELSDLKGRIMRRKYTCCQSCGTELQFNEIRNGIIYCSHCHNGYSFIDPQISFEKMKEVISKKMVADGLPDYTVAWHMQRLGTLYRWKPIFKWEKVDFERKQA